MFRTICLSRCSSQSINVRTKVIFAPPNPSLSNAERMKLWNKENKTLFGNLLESSQQRSKKLLRNAKKVRASSESDANKTVLPPLTEGEPNEQFGGRHVKKIVKKGNDDEIVADSLSALEGVNLAKTDTENNSTMFSNLTKIVGTRGFKTYSKQLAAQTTSAVSPGYAVEDKILQIRPHQHDYSVEYPSVTLILNKTMTEESRKALEKWKEEKIAEMGLEEFNKFYQAQMAVGTKFHETLKRYFTQPKSKLMIEREVEGVWSSVGELLKSISSPKAIESNVVHPVLKYRGIFDAIADFEEKPTLIEWKKSDRPRTSIAMTYDNPIQLAAYFGAVINDGNYKHLNVRDALLVIAYTDGSKADTFHLPIDKLREHWAHWLARLEGYIKAHGSDPEKILKGGKRLFEEDIGNLQN